VEREILMNAMLQGIMYDNPQISENEQKQKA